MSEILLKVQTWNGNNYSQPEIGFISSLLLLIIICGVLRHLYFLSNKMFGCLPFILIAFHNWQLCLINSNYGEGK